MTGGGGGQRAPTDLATTERHCQPSCAAWECDRLQAALPSACEGGDGGGPGGDGAGGGGSLGVDR